MQEFRIRPAIRQYDDCAQFVSDLGITGDDLILTNEYIFRPHFESMRLPCPVLYQERYGSGEPSDDMFRALLADAACPHGRIIAIGGGTILDLAKLLALKTATRSRRCMPAKRSRKRPVRSLRFQPPAGREAKSRTFPFSPSFRLAQKGAGT